MRVCYMLLAIATTLVAVTDAAFTSAESNQANVANLVAPDGVQTAQVAPKRFLRKQRTELGSKEERAGDINLLTYLPKFVKKMEGKKIDDVLLHLQQLRFSEKQREAFFKLYQAHLEKAAKAAAAATRS